MTQDYKSTVYLPRTDFPMKAGLPKREPEILARWEETNLYRRIREASKGREKFILHDGPPYANGHLHIGHALNKVLKDVINRCQQMLGKDANYVPGWDCHGLPIEWKIEEKYRRQKKDKDEVPVVEFRKECREFADEWIDVQRTEFKRMGVVGNWDHPYTTMTYAAEAKIADIEERITQLDAMKRALGELVAQCRGEGPLSDCPILDALDEEWVVTAVAELHREVIERGALHGRRPAQQQRAVLLEERAVARLLVVGDLDGDERLLHRRHLLPPPRVASTLCSACSPSRHQRRLSRVRRCPHC